MTKNKKGFLTLAVGSYYRYLAKYLAISYRLNSNNYYPLAVVTDERTEELEKYYDSVIVTEDEIKDGYLYKLNLYNYSPFEETIFIDADSFVIRDISYYWELFKESNFGVFGINSTNYRGAKNFFNPEKVLAEFDVTTIPKFNGGVYYFKKNEKVKKVFLDALALTERYDEFEMPRFKNAEVKHAAMGDEPLFSLAMVINNVKAVEDPQRRAMYNLNGSSFLKMDVLKQTCFYLKNGKPTNPSLVHFGTDRTGQYHYRKEVLKMYLTTHVNLNRKAVSLLTFPYAAVYVTGTFLYRLLMLKFKDMKDIEPTKSPYFELKKRLKRNVKKVMIAK